MRAINPWVPMTQPIDLKHIRKLIEELAECTSAAARCSIQGIDEAEPTTGKMNRQWLQEELADVLACIDLVVEHFGLEPAAIEFRRARKRDGLRAWHRMLP